MFYRVHPYTFAITEHAHTDGVTVGDEVRPYCRETSEVFFNSECFPTYARAFSKAMFSAREMRDHCQSGLQRAEKALIWLEAHPPIDTNKTVEIPPPEMAASIQSAKNLADALEFL